MRLVHLTDPHLTTPHVKHRLSLKRISGYLSWYRRRRHIHRPELLQLITEAVRAERSDQILLTGDLTQIGLADEIASARSWLQSLGTPGQVQLVPGNHDLYAGDSWSAVCAQWGDYLPPDAVAAGDPRDAFPRVTETEAGGLPLRIVALCSAIPTAPLLARGSLGNAQRTRLDDCEAQAHAFTCVLLHHPPLPGAIRWRKALADAAQLEHQLVRLRPQLVLYGHTHTNAERLIRGETVFAVTASASARGDADDRRAAYRVFDIEAAHGVWHVEMTLKGIDPDSGESAVRGRAHWTLPQAGQLLSS